jgi:hypothetical protein
MCGDCCTQVTAEGCECNFQQLLTWLHTLCCGVCCVQVTAEGFESDLQQLLTWLHTGSPQADVSGVNASWGAATGEFDDFNTLWTA